MHRPFVDPFNFSTFFEVFLIGAVSAPFFLFVKAPFFIFFWFFVSLRREKLPSYTTRGEAYELLTRENEVALASTLF